MKDPEVLDVSELPNIAFGSRAPLWWGIVLLILIEGTAFFLLFATYFYLRGNSQVWPPEGIRTFDAIYPAVSTVLLLASMLPMHLTDKAALHADVRGMRRWLIISTIPAVVSVVFRSLEFKHMPFTWYDHAYGSVVWTMLGLHTIHLVTGIFENGFLIAVLFKGPVEKKHQVDVRAGSLYWCFMVLSWLPIFAVIYAERVL